MEIGHILLFSTVGFLVGIPMGVLALLVKVSKPEIIPIPVTIPISVWDTDDE